jgi:hypothetical protein
MVKHPVIHLAWIVFILLLAIAALVVYSPDGNVMYNYVSFASGISSIALAFVAIVYSMVSNRGFDSSLGEIRAAALKIADETSRLNVASQGLSREAEETLRRLSDVPTKLDQMSGELGKKLDSLRPTELFEGQTPQQHPSDGSEVEAGGKPIGLVLALYILAKSEQHTKHFDPENIFLGDRHRAIRHYIYGVSESLKHFGPPGVVIDGVAGAYLVRSLGSLDLTDLVATVEAGTSGNTEFEEWREQVAQYFQPGSNVEGQEEEPETPS